MLYSAEEIVGCLHFFRLNAGDGQQQSDDGGVPNSSSTPITTPEWWPCLRCDHLDMVIDICKQVDYLMDAKSTCERSTCFLKYLAIDARKDNIANPKFRPVVMLLGPNIPTKSRYFLNDETNWTLRSFQDTTLLLQIDFSASNPSFFQAVTDLFKFAETSPNKRSSAEADANANKRLKSNQEENSAPKAAAAAAATTENMEVDDGDGRNKTTTSNKTTTTPGTAAAAASQPAAAENTCNEQQHRVANASVLDDAEPKKPAAIEPGVEELKGAKKPGTMELGAASTATAASTTTTTAAASSDDPMDVEREAPSTNNSAEQPAPSANAATQNTHSDDASKDSEKDAEAATNEPAKQLSDQQPNDATASKHSSEEQVHTAAAEKQSETFASKDGAKSAAAKATEESMEVEKEDDSASETSTQTVSSQKVAAAKTSATESEKGAKRAAEEMSEDEGGDAANNETPVTRRNDSGRKAAAKTTGKKQTKKKNRDSPKEQTPPPSNRTRSRSSVDSVSTANGGRRSSTSSSKASGSKKTPSTSQSKKAKAQTNLIDVEIPSFRDVKELLERVGYKFKKRNKKIDQYCRPARDEGGKVFETEDAFRRDLCAYGVSCNCGRPTGFDNRDEACECWDEDETHAVHCWVRYSVLRGPHKAHSAPEITQPEAKKLLLEIGFKEFLSTLHPAGFALPGVSQEDGVEGETYFQMVKDLFHHLSRFGLPDFCDFHMISEEERFHLEFFLSVHHTADTFAYLPEKAATSRRRPSREARVTSHPLPSDSATVVSEPSPPPIAKMQTKKRSVTKASTNSISQTQLQLHTHSVEGTGEAAGSDAPRVSMGPDLAGKAPPPLPVFEGTAMEKLEACLDALNPSHQPEQPTFLRDKPSSFAFNMGRVRDFVQAVLSAECCHSGDEEKSAALYCCGPPGIGKTSGITWCCQQIVSAWDEEDGHKPILCEMNASEKSWPETLKTIGYAVGLRGKYSVESVEKRLQNEKYPILLVIDEVDILLSSQGGRCKADGLAQLLKWASDDEMHFALIGISNSMNDEKAHKIQDAGEFAETVMFSAYSEDEICGILKARVGHSVVAPSTLAFAAKKIAAASGDVRKAFELTATAIQNAMKEVKQMDPQKANEVDSTGGHLVLPKHLGEASKEETTNYQDRIDGQPLTGKMILCIITIFAQAKVHETTLGELKNHVTDCLRAVGKEDDILELDDFVALLTTLIDGGLLRASSSANIDNVLDVSHGYHQIYQAPIFIGSLQEDIAKALDNQLKQSYFCKIREAAEKQTEKLQKR